MTIDTSAKQLKKNYIWNTLSSLMNAASSVLMLAVVTRTAGAVAGGVFSLAYAVAQQFIVVGQFEVRLYQVTDTKEVYPFGVYLATRIITTTLMIVGIFLFALQSQGISYEGALYTLIASLRIFDVVEDVFHGMFQQRGRLDIAGRAFFFRILTTVISFSIGVFITKNLLISAAFSFICSMIAMIALTIPPAKKMSSLRPLFNFQQIFSLLRAMLPMFIGAFLFTYVVNAPRYALGALSDQTLLTYFASLAMPAMVINLLSNFVFKPLLTQMAEYWNNQQDKQFVGLILKGFAVVALATVVSMALAWPLGAPVLGLLYGLDFEPYKLELLLLLFGGLINALAVILYYAAVTMRKQVAVFVSYAAGAGFAALTGGWFVGNFGIMGACVLYDASLAILALVFGVFCFLGFKDQKKKSAA